MINLGIETSEFLARHFEKSLHFQSNGLSDRSFQWANVERMLYQWDPADARLSMHLNGLLSPDLYIEQYQDLEEIKKRINRVRLEALLHQGATFVMNRVDARCPVIGAICQSLTSIAGERVVANGYMAFGGGGTFGKHWDTHDVFAVQLIGRKRWRIYEPTFELPLPNQRSKNKKHECPETPVFDRILEVGDVVYIPRGWWHVAEPLVGEETFHIAAGIHTAKTVDYLGWLAEHVMPAHLAARRSLLGGSQDKGNVEEFLRVLSMAALDEDNLRRFTTDVHAMRDQSRGFDFSTVAQTMRLNALQGESNHKELITTQSVD